MTSRPKPIARVSAQKYLRLGDAVAAVAKPIAKVIDNLAGTHLSNCPACAKRREKLNKAVPL